MMKLVSISKEIESTDAIINFNIIWSMKVIPEDCDGQKLHTITWWKFLIILQICSAIRAFHREVKTTNQVVLLDACDAPVLWNFHSWRISNLPLHGTNMNIWIFPHNHQMQKISLKISRRNFFIRDHSWKIQLLTYMVAVHTTYRTVASIIIHLMHCCCLAPRVYPTHHK